ncbi:MerR family transcriptional regulator [Streptomyces sp. 8N706]|uniref:MerR family transcriptional regulator n=1 Tax=Streptomyces sp. 8N706 TaxID=3457416 RepID=UPI003FD636B8
MRIGELSRRTRVTIPTIKYYVREGLLPAGQLTSPNQATYDASHERRLRLIRALLEVGGLSVAGVREVLAAVDDPAKPVHKVLGAATSGVTVRYGSEFSGEGDGEPDRARTVVAELIARRGWTSSPSSPAAKALAGALDALQRLGHGDFVEVLDDYADAVEKIAEVDLGYVGSRAAVDDLVESVVIGTVLGEAVLTAMRRLAHADASARWYTDGGTPGARGADAG